MFLPIVITKLLGMFVVLGLGIRDLKAWNKAAIFHQIWRLSKPGVYSLWTLWIRECLFKAKSFRDVNLPSGSSWCIKEIMKHRNEALQFLSFVVRRNSRFLLWHDPWLGREPHISKLGSEVFSLADSFNLAPVCSIISENSWQLSTSNHVVIIELRRLIASINITHSDQVL